MILGHIWGKRIFGAKALSELHIANGDYREETSENIEINKNWRRCIKHDVHKMSAIAVSTYAPM